MAVDFPEELISFFNNRIVSLLLAIFPFIPFAVAVVTYRYLRLDYAWTSRISTMAIVLIIAGSIIAWLTNFPRWSYAFITIEIALLLALMIGRDLDMSFTENLIFKLIILLPVIIVFTIIWLLTRRTHPARRFIENIRADWTLIPFMVYSLLPGVISSTYSSIRSAYGAPFLTVSSIFAITGVIIFMRSAQAFRRVAALLIFNTLAWIFMTVGCATYWDGRQLAGMAAPGNGIQIVWQYAGIWAVMVLLMFLPKIVGRLRRSAVRN
jgi:hypothetical protein